MSRSLRPNPPRHVARALRLQRQKDTRARRRARQQAVGSVLGQVRLSPQALEVRADALEEVGALELAEALRAATEPDA